MLLIPLCSPRPSAETVTKRMSCRSAIGSLTTGRLEQNAVLRKRIGARIHRAIWTGLGKWAIVRSRPDAVNPAGIYFFLGPARRVDFTSQASIAIRRLWRRRARWKETESGTP